MEPPRGNTALGALFWRDEILQVLFWMQGEGLADSVQAEDLLPFLNGDVDTIRHHLARCAKEGYLKPGGDGRFALSEGSLQEAGRRFSEAFAEMQKPPHGECSADCDCQGDPTSCKHYHA